LRQLELQILNKLKKDFPTETEVLEKGIDTLVLYGEQLKDLSPYNKWSNKLDDLLHASAEHRCLITRILLLNHSIGHLKAARLLLLTGYIVPAMSCLRTSYESFQNAHICGALDEQTKRFLAGKKINKKVNIPTPSQLSENTAKDMKEALSSVGVHPSYKSLENQGYFEGSIFRKENRVTYEFIFLRCLWSFSTMQLYLFAYLVETWPELIKKIPDAVKVATELRKMVDYTKDEFMKLAKNYSRQWPS